MSGLNAVVAALADNWKVFREHRPAGSYLPSGLLDGDCRACGDSWPCQVTRDVLGSALLAEHPTPEGVTLTKAEREDVAEWVYEAYRLGRSGIVNLPMWHELADKPTGTPEAALLLATVERIIADRQAPTVALDVETVRGVLSAHDGDSTYFRSLGEIECGCGEVFTDWDDHEAHQAAAVVAADPRRSEATVKAEALREAARDLYLVHLDEPALRWVAQPTAAAAECARVAAELNAEADRIEAGQ